MLPKNKVPKSLLASVFSPDFQPKDLSLNNFVREGFVPQSEAQVVAKIETLAEVGPTQIVSGTNNSIPVPLTEQEAAEADRQIGLALARIASTKRKLGTFRQRLDKAVLDSNGGKELQFSVSIDKKRRVKKAMKTLYGDKLETITYSMYIELMKAKALLEIREAKDYSAGKLKTDEDE